MVISCEDRTSDDSSIMKAIVLAGGLGTRLRPLTFAIPKPLIPVGERPILEHVLTHLAGQQVREVILAVGYRAELVETYFRDGSDWGIRIEYHREGEPLGTAGPLRPIRDRFGLTEPLLVINADILAKVDLGKMRAFHETQRADLTVGWRHHSYRLPFGLLEFEDGALSGIREKPEMRYPTSAGLYLLDPSILDLIPAGQPADMPELINRTIGAGRRVATYLIEEAWRAIESLGDLHPSDAGQ